MHAYMYELTLPQNGVLTLENLPFQAGENVEIIIVPRPKPKSGETSYPFWGKPVTYLNPTDPVAEMDWEVFQ